MIKTIESKLLKSSINYSKIHNRNPTVSKQK